MPTPEPIHLTDSQITQLMQLARPLQPAQRRVFVEMIAARLNGQREIGDGALYQIRRELQRQVLGAPIEQERTSRKRTGSRVVGKALRKLRKI
jgi:hypothetical protein